MKEKTVTRHVRSQAEAMQASLLIQNRSIFPFYVQIKQGKEPRSNQQNRLQFQWMNDLESQGDQLGEDYRAYCKLHFGVPLLRMRDESFRDVYDRLIRPLNYEQKLEMMKPPIDLPVTSRMSVKTMTAYLNQIWDFYTLNGFQLTDPSLLGIDDYEKWAA